MIEKWPVESTLQGNTVRDICRLGLILRAAQFAHFDPGVIHAPERYVPSDETTRSEFYKEAKYRTTCAQIDVLNRYTPEMSVPEFDEARAAGCPGIMNFARPSCRKGSADEWIALVRDGTPNIQKVVEFLQKIL